MYYKGDTRRGIKILTAIEEGIINLDKPEGMVCMEALNILKRRFKWRKIGHVGTLDPMASGVLPICVGRATKIVRYLIEGEKEYAATIRLGISTETHDREGRVRNMTKPMKIPTDSEIGQALKEFEGVIEQTPPLYSALKYRGKRLYQIARKGLELPEIPCRKVYISKIIVHEYSYPFIKVTIVCGRGTYIRSIAADLGLRLGIGAHIHSLKRFRVGLFTIHNAISLDRLDGQIIDHKQEWFFTTDEALSFIPSIKIGWKEKEDMLHGRPFLSPTPIQRYYIHENKRLIKIYDPKGIFLGLAKGEDDLRLLPALVFK
ncbi:MAG: tRNA pseudouridine(55) synthase TruB [bacterium]